MSRLTIFDLMTPEGWEQRAGEEARAGKAVLIGAYCGDCRGAVLTSSGGASRLAKEFGVKACACGCRASENELNEAHGLLPGDGFWGARAD